MSTVREYIRQLLEVKGIDDLVSVEVRLRVRTVSGKDKYTVPDIMTNIRVAPTIAICRQTIPIQRVSGGTDILTLEIKFMPDTNDMFESLDKLGKLLKTIPGIEIVKITQLGGRSLLQIADRDFVY